MSAPNVDFTYFWNWSTRTEFAEYVQFPTTTAPSFWISALICRRSPTATRRPSRRRS
jgi:hypothetical protein